MELRLDLIKKLLLELKFSPKDGTTNIWNKKYKNNYSIHFYLDSKDLSNSKIDYGKKIKVGRNTTNNLKQTENLVVLECVNRLLEKGYSPENIILEKDWKLGHKGKGFLDIQVLDSTGKSFLMIECKTFGNEYNKELANINEDGGQLFSYFIQEKSTKYLCLYTSTYDNNSIKFFNSIINITENIRNSENQQEAFENWSPQVLESKGLLEENVQPYKAKFSGITKQDLKPLEAEDGSYIFNRFAEILRKNVVSDKTNAFNKIFNLFLCKIVDEFETQEDEICKFQWKESESNEEVLLRLNDLYKRGMDLYLNLKISAVSEEELNKELENIQNLKGKEHIRNLFIQQKLYSGNEFTFKEVFDKITFDKNCIVVKEVVKLLEKYKIKYNAKQQFLGDFFEKLLNTGIKQEAGQFFTPIPIARFICKSLPIYEIINKKNNKKEQNFLPYVIDYASGSGHFLTEMMDEINSEIIKIDKNWIKGGEKAIRQFENSKNFFIWAKEYVYGIEKDYRLAKTTKISTFLNGDGDANIICGDGLDNFFKSKDYIGKLKDSKDGINNKQFDIIVANPPYSVSGFKTTLNSGKKTFKLYDEITDNSSEIECLFIERTIQLLKEGGVAGIILPLSIINSTTKIYCKTRDLIFKNFLIKGIVQLGNKTFMATGSNTIILFLEKIDSENNEKLKNLLENSFKSNQDLTINGIIQPIQSYLDFVYSEFDFIDFISLRNKNPTKKILESNFFQEYLEYFNNSPYYKSKTKNKEYKTLSVSEKNNFKLKIMYEFILEKEFEKIYNYIITFNQKIILVNTPKDSQYQKDFLGYSFSDRKGFEGISLYKDELGKLQTALYNEELNNDNKKVNYYLKKSFNSEECKIDKSLINEVSQISLYELLDFESIDFVNSLNPNPKVKIEIQSKWKLEKLSKLIETLESGNRPKGGVARIKEGILSIGGEHLNLNGELFLKKPKFVPENFFNSTNQGKIESEDILICKDGALTGKVAFVNKNFKEKAMVNEHVFRLKSNSDLIKQKYLFYYLYSEIGQLLLKNSITGMGQGGLNRPNLFKIKIPLPDEKTQNKIIEEIANIENETVKNSEELKMKKIKTEGVFKKYL